VDLNTFLSIIWRRKLVLLIMTLVTLPVVALVTLLETPVYAATTTLRVSTTSGRSGDSIRPDDLTYIERLMNTYGQIATSDLVVNEVARQLGVEERPKLEVALPANTEFMRLKAEHGDPRIAARAADLAADLLIREVRRQNEETARGAQERLSDQIAELETELATERQNYERLRAIDPASVRTRVAREALALKEESLTLLVREFQEARIADALRSNPISVAEKATVPTSQASPRVKLNLALGLILGLLAGLGLAFLAERLDPRIQTNEEVRELTDAPVIATVPARRSRRGSFDRGKRLFERDSLEQEAMRRLPAHFARHPIKTLLVTSAGAQEGKTTIVANAAVVLARAGNNVAAVDADLREPALHTAFGLPETAGLANVLRGEMPLESAIQSVEPGRLSVLTTGALPEDAHHLLGSRRMATVLAELEAAFDAVIIDSPPFLPLSDAAILAGAVRQVLVVVGLGQSRRDAVNRMFIDLARIEANVVGVVINRAAAEGTYSNYYRPRLRAVGEDAEGFGDDVHAKARRTS
jgi:capsular exopolysaccharide synthesis family protein